MRVPIVVTALAAATGLIVTGCGGSSSTSAPSTASAPSTQTSPATTTPPTTTRAPATTSASTPEVNPSGDIPDNQAFVAFSPPSGGFSVKVPEGWARTTAGGAVTFTDKLNAIRMESQPATKALTVASAKAVQVPALARQVKGFQAGDVSSVSRTAGTAVLITYLARSPADPVTGKSAVDAVERYGFFHAGTQVTLTLSGPKGADNVDPWRIVTDSLRWTA